MVDLINYTAVYRKGKYLRFGNRMNKREFSTEREAKRFEHLYNRFAITALEVMMSLIKDQGVVKNAEKLSRENLASYAKMYYLGGGIAGGFGSIRGSTLDDVLERTEEMYSLSKKINILKEEGLI